MAFRLDIYEAFNSANHSILLQKIEKFGIDYLKRIGKRIRKTVEVTISGEKWISNGLYVQQVYHKARYLTRFCTYCTPLTKYKQARSCLGGWSGSPKASRGKQNVFENESIIIRK